MSHFPVNSSGYLRISWDIYCIVRKRRISFQRGMSRHINAYKLLGSWNESWPTFNDYLSGWHALSKHKPSIQLEHNFLFLCKFLKLHSTGTVWCNLYNRCVSLHKYSTPWCQCANIEVLDQHVKKETAIHFNWILSIYILIKEFYD